MNVPELLSKATTLGHVILVTPAVYMEIKGDNFQLLQHAISQDSIKLCPKISRERSIEIKSRNPALSNGEIEVIVLGLYLKSKDIDHLCVLDDKKARKVADGYGLRVIGTIGLLEYYEKEGLITSTEKEDLIKVLKNSTFRLQ
jgi:hypothetical protein